VPHINSKWRTPDEPGAPCPGFCRPLAAFLRFRRDARREQIQSTLPQPGQTRQSFDFGRFQLTPYTLAEFYYDSRLHNWTRCRYVAGADRAITRHVVLEEYLLRRDSWHFIPQMVNATGVAPQFFIRWQAGGSFMGAGTHKDSASTTNGRLQIGVEYDLIH
jgi:hypothetical protein